jgi:hypothetical protein
MVKFVGFVELKFPKVLLKKLRCDLMCLKQATNNQYDVFDYFVTADNMHDWVSSRDNEFRGSHFNDGHPLQSQKISIDDLVKSYCRG